MVEKTTYAGYLITAGTLGLLLVLGGCAGKHGASSAGITPPDGSGSAQPGSPELRSAALPTWQLQGAPALPHDAPLDAAQIALRRSAAVGVTPLFGSQVYNLEQATAQVDSAEHSCVLKPGAGELSWAMYAFPNLLPEDLPLVITLYPLGEQPAGPCYVGLSDFNRGTWDWTAFDFPQQAYPFPVPTTANPISPGATLYLVVATWDSVPLAIGRLGLELDCPAPPPDGFDVEPGNGVDLPVHLSWIDPAVSYDPDGDGPGQYSYDGVQIQRAESPEGPWTDLALVPPGTTEYDDQSTLGNPPPGGSYDYHLMTLITGIPVKPGFVMPGYILTTNQLVARFTASPTTGSAGISVAFDATSSIHVGGPYKSVQWDFEGDGVFDSTTVSTLTASHVYPTIGRKYPTLKLTMDIGGGATMTHSVTGFVAVDDKRGDWAQLGRNSQHTSRSPFRGPKTPTLRGSYTASKEFASPVIGADGTVYATCRDGSLRAFNPSCAMLREWSGWMDNVSAPAIDYYGYIWFYKFVMGYQYCIWPDNTKHEYDWDNFSGEPVIANDGVNLLVAGGPKLFQCKPVPPPGTLTWYNWVWTAPTTPSLGTPAGAPDGSIYVTAGNALYKLSSAGKQLWQVLDVYTPHDPSVGADGSIYVHANYSPPAANALLCYGSDASLKWKANLAAGESCLGAPSIAASGNIYISTNRGRVYGFTPAGGLLFPPGAEGEATFLTPPLIDADGNMYLLNTLGSVISLTSKLHSRWSYPVGAPPALKACGLALGSDGTLYIGGSKKLVALN